MTVIHLRRARLVPLEDAAFEYRLALLRVRATMLAALKALANVQYDPVVHGAQLIDHATAALATLDRPHAQYALAHEVEVLPGGVLAGIVDRARFQVNSVHGQAVNRLAEGLRVEARAPDGLVEAFSDPRAAGFNLCVQWHPEWKAASNPVSVRLLRAFGDACRAYRDRPRAPQPAR